ncbi:hypothetical protein NBRC116494_06710 [Aurantivibrio plasticivorans]
MSQNKRPDSFFAALRKVTLCASGIYLGTWLMKNGDQGFYWIGYLFVCCGSFLIITALLRIVITSKDTALQLSHETQTRTPSGIFGRASLACESDTIIQTLIKGEGFLVGLFKGALLFFDPFAEGMSHMVSLGTTRVGKTISLVIPAALYWLKGSMFVTDTKGEIYKITEDYRSANNHKTVKWSPFKVNGDSGVSINPLQCLIEDVTNNQGKKLKELASDFAYILLPANPEDKQPFFARGGRRLLIAMMCYLAVFEKSKCHLPGLREMIWSSMERKKEIFTVMKSCIGYGGILREYANLLEKQIEPEYFRTFGPMLENAMEATDIFERHTDFGKSLMKSDYDLEEFLKTPTTLYIIFSEDTSEQYGIAAGLMAVALFKKIGARPKGFPILFLLEEAGNIGVFPKLETVLSILTAKNVRVWLIFQSLMQLVLKYGLNRSKAITSQCGFKQYLSVNDLEEAENLSKRSGRRTTKTYQYSHDPQNKDAPWRLSVSETGENVLSADQALISEEEEQFIDIRKKPLIKANFVRYFEIKEFRETAKPSPYHDGYPSDKPVKYSLKGEMK